MAKVLVIDDSSFQRKWITRTLQSLDYETVEAINGQKGLDILDAEKPDLITIDLNMPEMDGIQFLASLKSRENTPPVIVITADIQDESKKQCMVLGARAFITKPFKNSDLEEAINGCLKNQKIES